MIDDLYSDQREIPQDLDGRLWGKRDLRRGSQRHVRLQRDALQIVRD